MRNLITLFLLVLSVHAFAQTAATRVYPSGGNIVTATASGTVTGTYAPASVKVQAAGDRIGVTIGRSISLLTLSNFLNSAGAPYSTVSVTAAISAYNATIPTGGGGSGSNVTALSQLTNDVGFVKDTTALAPKTTVAAAQNRANAAFTKADSAKVAAAAAQNIATQALATSTATLQSETIDYVNRVKAAGGTLDAVTISAVDDAINEMKLYGLITPLKTGFFWAGLGNNLASSLVKLLYNPATAGNMVNTGFVEADFSQKKGLGVAGTNTTKYLATGVIPSALGLVSNNIAFGTFSPDATGQANNLLGITPTSGSSPFFVSNQAVGYSAYNSTSKPGPGFKGASYTSSSIDVVFDGLTSYNIAAGQPSTTTQNTEVNLFRSTVSGASAFSGGKLSAAFVASGLTNTQLRALARIIQKLSFAAGSSQKSGNKLLVFGNSIEAGVGASSVSTKLSTIVAGKLGAYEINTAASGSQLRQESNAIRGGFQKYLEVGDIDANILLCGIGINDNIIADLTTNGDASIISDFTAKYNQMVAYWKTLGMKIILFYPYSSSSNDTKMTAYLNAVKSVAATNDVPLVDGYTLIKNQVTPANFMADVVHPNDAGHKLYGNAIATTASAYGLDYGNSFVPGVGSINTTGSIKAVQYKLSTLNTAPLSATDIGLLGEIRVTAGFIYICTATNTWVRAALSSW